MGTPKAQLDKFKAELDRIRKVSNENQAPMTKPIITDAPKKKVK